LYIVAPSTRHTCLMEAAFDVAPSSPYTRVRLDSTCRTLYRVLYCVDVVDSSTRDSGYNWYMYYAYILYSCKYDEFYCGYTEDLRKRYTEHKNGKVKSTKNRDMSLLFYEAFRSEKDARRREQYFKTTKGKRTLKIMLKDSLTDIKEQK